MIERFLHHLRVELPPADETATIARERLREKLPRQTVRRMTHLGLLVGSTFDGLTLGTEDAVVYATTFAETRALEDFLLSFPTASPQLFQASIHPSAVQQVLIGRQQPVARLWPLAGRRRLVEQALLAALLEPAPRVVLTGGEERGTWMLAHGMSSPRSFAFAGLFTSDATAAIGRVGLAPSRGPEPGPDEPCPSLEEFALALAEHRALAWSGEGGDWTLSWP
ncbi:MAG: hypothetical protein NTV51_17330 [Verrucomicrobia bacterium]|nr:hypothetical protein [Verrucomicrobiota bacterium]